MKKLKTLLVLLIAAASLTSAYGQKLVLRGRVLDTGDNTAVIGANIIEYDEENRIINGTITNVNGDFVLEMKNSSHIVKVSVIGYETKEIPVDGSKQITVMLAPANLEIEEVTVTAKAQSDYNLTNIAERDNASSTVKINLADMSDAGISSASDALQGKVSGLDIIAASGDPGSGSQLVIRGLSSMGNSSPLIVVDGIPQMRVQSGFDLSSADTEDISELVNIALQDIKSIEILKDAASTAVYGSQGADGVLLIETFKGRMGKVQFDYQYKSSLNIQPPAIPMLSGNEYIMLQLEEWHNSRGVFDIPDEIAYNTDYKDFYNYSANTDWIGAITQDAMTHDHYFKVSGGGEKTRYFTSFSYVDEGGTTINTSSKRFSTRINLDYYLSRNILFSVQFNYTNNKTDGNLELGYNPSTGKPHNIRSMAYIKAPNMSIWEYDPYGNLTGEYFTPIESYQGNGSDFFNPVGVANLGKKDEIRNNLQNTFRLRYRIADWLTFHEVIAFQYAGIRKENYLPYDAIGADWLAWTINKAEEANEINSSIRTESRMTFEAPFRNKDHEFTGAVSWITDQSSYEWMNIQSNKTPSTDIQDPAINAQINWIGGGSGEARQLGALANLNYKYKDKYMLQTIARADAHSSFGVNYRWGIFKGISGAWRFSNEPWFENVNWLGESMLRFSWGVSGRQPWDAYARFATYNSSQTGSYIESPAIVPQQIQLNNLKWESSAQTDIGLELNLFDDRVYIEGDIYSKITSDLLFYRYKVPFSSGYSYLTFYNGGELQNNGWELMLDFKIIRNENWLWSVNFNTSQNVNRFNDLPDNFNREASTSIGNGQYPRQVVEGEAIGSFFGFRYLGVWSSDADVVARNGNGDVILDNEGIPVPLTYKGTYVFKGGDPIYEDINHDGIIDLNDVVYIGDSNPDFMGGFGTTVKYKNFDFSTSFHYRLGFDIVNGVAIQTEGMNNKNNQSKAVLRRWRVQGQDNENMLQRAYLYHPANNLGSDRYVEPGDYLRLINLKVGYRLPNKICQKMNIRSMNISASARKIVTFTNYSGQDPEVSTNASDPFWIGFDYANTPPPKILTLSINIGI